MPNVWEEDGPLLLLAGPGTGKTYTLGLRVRHLVVDRGVDPTSITVITFTSAAAANMRDRISNPENAAVYLDPGCQPRVISTMHSLGHQIVARAAGRLGLSEPFRVLVSGESSRILMGDAAQLAGSARRDAEAAEGCRRLGRCERDGSSKCQVCQWYGRILRACNAVDHDDQIMLACQTLGDDAALLGEMQGTCRHLLVDEYQDINPSQFQLIQLLTRGQREGLFVVGDDDQSIYSWRGGSPEFIRRFEEHFGVESKVRALLRSRRCHPAVLEGALGVVTAFDEHRRRKGTLTYARQEGPKIVLHDVPSAQREADVVAAIANGARHRGVLILVPNRNYVPLISDRLRSYRLPFEGLESELGQGMPLLMWLWEWLRDDSDSVSLRVCLDAMLNGGQFGVPSRRSKTRSKLDARERSLAQVSSLWPSVMDGRASLWQALSSSTDELPGCLARVLGSLRTWAAGDVSTFLAEACKWLQPWGSVDSAFKEIEAWVGRAERGTAASLAGRIRIMTYQGAKGLEADVVCVTGVEEGVLPREDAEPAEQSRLLYVSMTRAVDELHLFSARQRPGSISYRARGPQRLKPSRFLAAIPAEAQDPRYHPPKKG